MVLASRALYSDKLGDAEKFLCEVTGFQKCILNNIGKIN